VFPSFLAALCFAVSAVTGSRAARMIGGTEANFWRLVVATVLLAGWAHGCGVGLTGDAFPIFIISGLVGIGIGDVALYQALPQLGARLTSLLLTCLTTVFAVAIEWVWLGARLTPAELGCGAVILLGVSLALSEGQHLTALRGHLARGLSWTALGALGNALGMVLSRKAYAVTAAAGQHIDGATAAYQRLIGGLFLSGLLLLLVKRKHVAKHVREPDLSGRAAKEKWRTVWPWVLVNGATGMTLGVSCVQWALMTTPTGIVQSVLSITPLLVIPVAQRFEGERPTGRSVVGGAIAVAGTMALTWVHTHR
jgi:drug/metabolite transporter (DMT)-like permease